MYDLLNDSTIKCFYSPVCYRFKEDDNYSIYKIDGNLKSYKDGDELPLKTLYYKYPSNFVIYDDDNLCLNIIKDSKLFKSVNVKNLNSNDISNIKFTFNTNGERLSFINDNFETYKNKLLMYSKAVIYRKRKIKEIYRNCNKTRKVLLELNIVIRSELNNYVGIIDFFDEHDYRLVNDYLNSKHISFTLNNKSLKESKFKLESILKDNFLGKELKNFIDSVIVLNILDRLNKCSIAESEMIKFQVEPIEKEFKETWICNIYEEEKHLGELIYLIYSIKYFDSNSNIDYIGDKEELDFCMKEIQNMLKKDFSIVKSYLDWIALDEENKTIVNNILKDF